MATDKRIVLYGKSVVVSGVGASLEHVSQFEVLHLTSSSAGLPHLQAMSPDVVVFDVESRLAGPAFSLLETRPGLLLLGISPDGNVVGLWSRRQYRVRSSKGLAELIEEFSRVSAPQECPFGRPQRAEEVWHPAPGDHAEGSAECRQGRQQDVTRANNARRGTDARP